jgi:hypothetical protein
MEWNGSVTLKVPYNDRRKNISADVSKFKILPFHVLLKPVLRGVDGSLHLTVPSMNRLNQTEPAAFSILQFWAFSRDSYFLYFNTFLVICWRSIHLTITTFLRFYYLSSTCSGLTWQLLYVFRHINEHTCILNISITLYT